MPSISLAQATPNGHLSRHPHPRRTIVRTVTAPPLRVIVIRPAVPCTPPPPSPAASVLACCPAVASAASSVATMSFPSDPKLCLTGSSSRAPSMRFARTEGTVAVTMSTLPPSPCDVSSLAPEACERVVSRWPASETVLEAGVTLTSVLVTLGSLSSCPLPIRTTFASMPVSFEWTWLRSRRWRAS